MKFELGKPEFRPVIITLETQEEADVLHALLGVAGGNHANGFTWKLYSVLGDVSDSQHQTYWTGGLQVKKDF